MVGRLPMPSTHQASNLLWVKLARGNTCCRTLFMQPVALLTMRVSLVLPFALVVESMGEVVVSLLFIVFSVAG